MFKSMGPAWHWDGLETWSCGTHMVLGIQVTGLVLRLAGILHFQVSTWNLSSWGLIESLAPKNLPWAMGVAEARMARGMSLWEPFRSLVPWKAPGASAASWGCWRCPVPRWVGRLCSWGPSGNLELWEPPGTTDAPVPGRAQSRGSQEATGSLVL